MKTFIKFLQAVALVCIAIAALMYARVEQLDYDRTAEYWLECK